MHRRECQCPRCINGRRTKKVVAVTIPSIAVIAIAAILLLYPSLIMDSLRAITPDNTPNTTPRLSPPNDDEPEGLVGNLSEPIINQEDDRRRTFQSWYQYALQEINEDREDFGLPPVELSDNEAAQVHAEDVLKTRQISHWMTNGEKPYMTYSKLGGTGYVGQNVYISGYSNSDYNDCKIGFVICTPIDPRRDIDQGEYVMMYEDVACCDNGHRDNILDPHHTHASMGIAYDAYFFVMVQNFENNYIDFLVPINANGNEIQITGTLPQGMTLYSINIEYDPLPTSQAYKDNLHRDSYDTGEIIAGVAPSGAHNDDIETIESTSWYATGRTVDIRFDISELSRGRPGVYTIDVWLQNEEATPILATNHALFIS